MPDLDRLLKLVDSRRTSLPGQAFRCASNTYEQQRHSDTVKLQAKRDCLGDRG